MRKSLCAALLLAAVAVPPSWAAPRPADDAFLEQYAATYRFRLGRPSEITVSPDGGVLFLRSGPRSFVKDLYAWDPSTDKERALLTAEQVLKGADENLSAAELARRERQRSTARGIASYSLSQDGSLILVPLAERLFLVERATGRVRELPLGPGGIIDPRFSPNGRAAAFVRGNELYTVDVASPTAQRLTMDSSKTISNGAAEFVAQEEMDRREGYWWSPDSRFLAYQQTDVSEVEEFHIGDLKNPEKEPDSWPYPRAGKANAHVRLGVIPAAGGPTVWLRWDAERYPYLAKVVWEKDAPLTLLVQNRAQTEERLLAADPADGSTRTLLVKRDEAWLNIDAQMPRWLPGGRQFLWSSESAGFPRLELRNADGSLSRELTSRELNYRELSGIDGARAAYVLGGPEPTERHLYRIPLDSKRAPRLLTKERGWHSAVLPGHGAVKDFVLTSSPISGPLIYRVLAADGRAIGQLNSKAEAPPFEPAIELASAGQEEFRSVLVRPRNFVPGRRYPVIVEVYGGPRYSQVRAAGRFYLLEQWIADQGYIVVSIDGRGTPGRGRAWERAIKGNFIRHPLEDQVAALKALGEKYKELDLSRVGIFGWSFGGYFTSMAVLQRPDVFHAGIAGAPVTDWRDYDTHYTERYMGLPDENKSGYDDSSVLTHAPKLSRPLLIIHGTTDDNVYFLHALKLSDALFRAGKRHEFLPLVGFTHMVHDPLAMTRLYEAMMDFFARSLPPAAAR